ncbi:MAG TPA: hypothetical protein VMU19_11590 [Bryobacteraceae bacterium]|nr:hypothetical protein [Bryobacteraceae bacterium]
MNRRTIIMMAAVLLALLAAPAFAADVTGKWTGEVGDGGFTITVNFHQDGTKLTGTIDGPGGEPMQIKDGKIDGNKISFSVTFDMGGGDMKMVHEGTVNGDEMTLNMKMEGGPDGGPGGGGPGPIKLKRVK